MLLKKQNASQFSLFFFFFSLPLLQNNGESKQKSYLTDLWTADRIQLFIAIKWNLSDLIFFFEWRGVTQRLIDKCSHLFICISLSYTLSNGQKPVQNPNIRTNSPLLLMPNCFTLDKFLFFCSLINKKVLKYFLVIICREHTLARSTNFLSRNHLELCFWLRRVRKIPNTESNMTKIPDLNTICCICCL